MDWPNIIQDVPREFNNFNNYCIMLNAFWILFFYFLISEIGLYATIIFQFILWKIKNWNEISLVCIWKNEESFYNMI